MNEVQYLKRILASTIPILQSSTVECAAEMGELDSIGISDYDALQCFLKTIKEAIYHGEERKWKWILDSMTCSKTTEA